jgi:hypothetical protein
MPEGWEDDPNWGSDTSVWAEMEDSAKPQNLQARGERSGLMTVSPQVHGWIAVREKAMREYLAQSKKHTIADEALKREVRLAMRAFTL